MFVCDNAFSAGWYEQHGWWIELEMGDLHPKCASDSAQSHLASDQSGPTWNAATMGFIDKVTGWNDAVKLLVGWRRIEFELRDWGDPTDPCTSGSGIQKYSTNSFLQFLSISMFVILKCTYIYDIWCHFCQLQTLKPLLGSVYFNYMGDKAQIMTISQSSLKRLLPPSPRNI